MSRFAKSESRKVSNSQSLEVAKSILYSLPDLATPDLETSQSDFFNEVILCGARHSTKRHPLQQ